MAMPTAAMSTPTAREVAQRTKSSREEKLADMRGGVIAYAASAQPETRAAMTPGFPATHTATATAPRSGA